MWHLTKNKVERWMDSVLHIHDTPQRSAAAFALGVAIGFSPFVGFHTLIGLALAFFLNLNRVAVLGGTWVNLPWFMGPYYAATTALGTWFTGTRMPPSFLAQLEASLRLPGWRDRMDALGHLFRPLLLPYMLGSLLVCVPIGFVTYRLTLAFVLARKRHHEHRPKPGVGTGSSRQA